MTQTMKMKPKVINSKELGGHGDSLSRLEKLYDYLNKIREENFTGYIKVNFSQGSVGRIERFEEILKK